jgi:hypothetical protein
VQVTNPGNGSSHFVLVTGFAGNTFFLNDPGHSDRITLDSYNNSFQIRGFVADPIDVSALYFATSGPGTGLVLSVTDPQSRVTGVVPGAQTPIYQIPTSDYFVDGPLEEPIGQDPTAHSSQFVYIDHPLIGQYVVQMSGNTGASQLSVFSVAPDGIIESNLLIPVQSPDGNTLQYNVALNSSYALSPPVQVSGPADVSAQVRATRSGLVYNRSTQLFGGTLTFTNTGTTALTGTLEVVFSRLPAGVTLANASGYTADGAPYILVNLANSVLARGASMSIAVYFRNPNRVLFDYGLDIFDNTSNG